MVVARRQHRGQKCQCQQHQHGERVPEGQPLVGAQRWKTVVPPLRRPVALGEREPAHEGQGGGGRRHGAGHERVA